MLSKIRNNCLGKFPGGIIVLYNKGFVIMNKEEYSEYRDSSKLSNQEEDMYKEELAIISQAVLNEMEGYEFYKMAGEQAKTQGNKEAFAHLAKEEIKHAEYLKKLWTILSDGGEIKIKEIMSSGIDIPSPEIYRWDKVDKAYATLGMSIFGIGMQMEKSSIDFYEDAKQKSGSQPVKDLFDLLIKWENVHLDQFTNQYNMLKEEWWAEQQFAPF